MDATIVTALVIRLGKSASLMTLRAAIFNRSTRFLDEIDKSNGPERAKRVEGLLNFL